MGTLSVSPTASARKRCPRWGRPESLSNGHGPEAAATHATPPRHNRLNAATRQRDTGTGDNWGRTDIRKLPAHRTRGMTDVNPRRLELCSAPKGEFLKIHKKRHQRHQRNRSTEPLDPFTANRTRTQCRHERTRVSAAALLLEGCSYAVYAANPKLTKLVHSAKTSMTSDSHDVIVTLGQGCAAAGGDRGADAAAVSSEHLGIHERVRQQQDQQLTSPTRRR